MKKTFVLMVLSTNLLTACSSTIPLYKAEEGKPTAKIEYDIPHSSFIEPTILSQQGLNESIRIDTTIPFSFRAFKGAEIIYLEYQENSKFNKKVEEKRLEAGLHVLNYSNQTYGSSLSDLIPICQTGLRVNFEPNGEYIIQGDTTHEWNKGTQFFFWGEAYYLKAKCQLKIIDKKTGKVFAETGYGNYSRSKNYISY
ncbi:hypothetical protein F544_11450 [Bibersteinia trehalosi USDA-ARS-USMARC-190]|uniref:Lipoprotein n=1 Tax=Bibersteinia trehalosi USDA-ARS-USMARC-190 TaxID=1263832 RepID=W0RAF9_BIBTR|nr:hypothetical protein [Bibersteinia trehalosi]AHG86373.1 hypothetical protein F544_11450 [Bibersteinia trehalosi USDA-ARS-USMARC-190]